jgi:acyl-CoA synthetase (AMP-forming)/AMP-acid ligase II
MLPCTIEIDGLNRCIKVLLRNIPYAGNTIANDRNPLVPEDVILHAAPLSHRSGLYSIPNVAKGAANVILHIKTFDIKTVFETIQRRRVINIFMAPAMIKRLITSPEIDKYDLSSIKIIYYGRAPIDKGYDH